MNITLKKAAALSHALGQVKIGLVSTVSIGKYDAIPDLTPNYDLINDKLDLLAAQYEIRLLIGKANEGRINQLITQRAMIDKQLEFLNQFEDKPKIPDPDRIAQEQADPKTYGAITVKIPYDVIDIKRGIKRVRLKVEDELAQLNYSTTIQLPDGIVALLQKHDLV